MFRLPILDLLKLPLISNLDLTKLQIIIIIFMVTLLIFFIIIYWISLRFFKSTSTFKHLTSKMKRNSKLKSINKLQSTTTTPHHHHSYAQSSQYHPSTTTIKNHHHNNNIFTRIKTTITSFIFSIKTTITSFIITYSNSIKTTITSFHSKSETPTIPQINSTTTTTSISPTTHLNSNSRKRKQKVKSNTNPNSTLIFNNKNQSNLPIKPKPSLVTIGTQTEHHNLDSSPRSRTISLQTISELHQDSNHQALQESPKTLSNRRSKPNLTIDFLHSRSDPQLHHLFQADQLTHQAFQRVPSHPSTQTQSLDPLHHFHHPTRSNPRLKPHSISTPPSPLLNQSTLSNHQLELTQSLCWTSPESSSICHQSHTSSTSTRTFSTSTTSSHLDLCQCQLHSSQSKKTSIQLHPHQHLHSSILQTEPTLHPTHADQTIISSQFPTPSHLPLERLSLGLEVHQNPKDILNPVITSWNKLCQPSASSSDSSRSNHSTSTHPSVINTNEDSLEQDLSHTLSPTISTHAFHEHAPLDVTQLGLGLRPTTAQDVQTRNRDQWTSDQIEQSSLTPDDQDHSHLFVAHPQLTHSPAALSSILPSSPSSSLPPTGSQLSEPASRSSYAIQESNIESPDQDPVATAAYLFQSSLHSPTRGFHPHHLPTRSVSTPDRSHHNSLPLPSLIPPTPPLCTPPHLSHLLSPPHPGLSHPPSPLPIPQSAQIYQHQLPSRSSFSGPPPFYYGPNGFHPSLIGSSSSSSAYTSGSAYQSHFLPSPSPYHPFSNLSNGVGASRSASHGSPNLNPTFYTGLYYTPTSNKKPSQSKRRASAAHYSSQNTTSTSSSYKPPRMEKEGENEIDRLKNRLKGVRSKVRELEVENQRKERELEIARWRLECVGVEKGLEEIETQKAIHHFLERAERSESYLKVLELKLNHQASLSSSLSNSTLNTKEEENEGFLRDAHEMEMNLDKEMNGFSIENGAVMKSVKTNMMMNEKEREENETNVNRIRKWQVVNEMDYDSLEIEFDE